MCVFEYLSVLSVCFFTFLILKIYSQPFPSSSVGYSIVPICQGWGFYFWQEPTNEWIHKWVEQQIDISISFSLSFLLFQINKKNSKKILLTWCRKKQQLKSVYLSSLSLNLLIFHSHMGLWKRVFNIHLSPFLPAPLSQLTFCSTHKKDKVGWYVVCPQSSRGNRLVYNYFENIAIVL